MAELKRVIEATLRGFEGVANTADSRKAMGDIIAKAFEEGMPHMDWEDALGYQPGSFAPDSWSGASKFSFRELFDMAYSRFKSNGDVATEKRGSREVEIYKNGNIFFTVGGVRCVFFDVQTHIAKIMSGNAAVEKEVLLIVAGHFRLAGIQGKVSEETRRIWEGIVPFV